MDGWMVGWIDAELDFFSLRVFSRLMRGLEEEICLYCWSFVLLVADRESGRGVERDCIVITFSRGWE